MQFLNTDFLESEEIKLVVDQLVEGDPERNWVPAYRFHICDLHGLEWAHVLCESDTTTGFTM